MCGIVGTWGAPDTALTGRLLDSIAHRGPDGQGEDRRPRGVVGHRRLAIMDPGGGAQPIPNEEGSRVVCANGEIYNFPALRREIGTTRRWRTGSDSEAILHLFDAQDTEATTKLRGMYAFAILGDDRLVLARDPIGIKPLYLGVGPGSDDTPILAFSSELTGLCEWASEVREFPPGYVFDSTSGFRRFARLPAPAQESGAVDDHVRHVRESLERAVTSHLMSDVPVGAFLSGGLDSSVIAAIARRHVDELHTFSVGTAGSPDLRAARRVAEHIGSTHHEYVISDDDVRRELPDIVAHLESFDQDLVRSAIPTHFCARLASQYVKVILTGEGADELFAGYRYHHDYADYDALHEELCRAVGTLHHINLQRVDRLTMRHGVEGRVPFLDMDFMHDALKVPAALKMAASSGPSTDAPSAAGQRPRTEKWVLRAACADLLPEEIVWRVKAQFDEGSGIVGMVERTIGARLEDARRRSGFDVGAYRAAARERLRSDEEALYHHLLTSRLSRPRMLLDNVARWTDHRVATVRAHGSPDSRA
jgi:asparagine synthase (glutamine-hydrolysing)